MMSSECVPHICVCLIVTPPPLGGHAGTLKLHLGTKNWEVISLPLACSPKRAWPCWQPPSTTNSSCPRTIKAVVLSPVPSISQLLVVELPVRGAIVDRSNVSCLTTEEEDAVIVFETVEVDEVTVALAIGKSIKMPGPDFFIGLCIIGLDAAGEPSVGVCLDRLAFPNDKTRLAQHDLPVRNLTGLRVLHLPVHADLRATIVVVCQVDN
jgi:hypothetical protein